MTIEQTILFPTLEAETAARHRLVEQSNNLPPSPKDETRIKCSAARQKLRELCKNSKLTVDGFLAMKHADRVLEAAIDERLSVGIKSS
ncbi:MAG: hypothetical protein LBU17_00210 [Treponema sp.]|jgi:hypothetical protein|nr:hypothetical protein [Treponema sp.]